MRVQSSLVTERYQQVSDEQLDQWVEQFHQDGFLFLEELLSPDIIEQLKADLEAALAVHADFDTDMQLRARMFEVSQANLSLFDLEPIVSFAERLVASNCHVFHNNSFRTFPGGGISAWHQDDDLHYQVTDDRPPSNVRLPVLFFTANYYLTDVEELQYGPTQVVRGSHLLGRRPPGSEGAVHGHEHAMEGSPYAERVVSCLGKAGSLVMFNNQLWHRGARNQSDRIRYITQVSYCRRIIASMYAPFMNYQMPEHVYAGADKRLRRLLGFKEPGPYG